MRANEKLLAGQRLEAEGKDKTRGRAALPLLLSPLPRFNNAKVAIFLDKGYRQMK
jgi:hypothetical protein